MLGDCYCAAVVEHLSKNELMALDAAAFYQDTSPSASNGHIMESDHNDMDGKESIPDSVILDIPPQQLPHPRQVNGASVPSLHRSSVHRSTN